MSGECDLCGEHCLECKCFMDTKNEVVLNSNQIQFFEYFISKYHKEFKEGNFTNSHHCAVAVLLEIDRILDHNLKEPPKIEKEKNDG